jgi:hypothetical protein
MASRISKGSNNKPMKDRVQVFNPKNDRWTKIDTRIDRFIDQKKDGKPFKRVIKEK